jgi:CheY-like chemotaxis protein
MVTKRALIVDDSKSARAFLSRILTKYEIEVDTAESAEQAIEYLAGERPDVIFMDHLMPGMDGFQAVQIIKNNPRTATIPIMMYTSQEGELYVGQARALGAIGVLPKQIQPADVSKVLYQLKLIPDRRTEEQRAFDAVMPGEKDTHAPAPSPEAAVFPATGADEPTIAGPSATAAELRAIVDSIVREHITASRRSITAHFDDQAARLIQDVRGAVQEALPDPALWAAPRAAAPRPWGWVAAVVAVLAATAIGALWWREIGTGRALAAQLSTTRAQTAALETKVATLEAAEAARAEEIASGVLAARTLAAEGILARALVPYGEIPLANDRLVVVRDALEKLAAGGFRGEVDITTYPGRFCLVGNATEGWSLAPDDTPVGRCELIGNPAFDGTRPAQRESLAFANLVAERRRESSGAIDVRVVTGDADDTAIAYPAIVAGLTAADWNRAGHANNRVELRARPTP